MTNAPRRPGPPPEADGATRPWWVKTPRPQNSAGASPASPPPPSPPPPPPPAGWPAPPQHPPQPSWAPPPTPPRRPWRAIAWTGIAAVAIVALTATAALLITGDGPDTQESATATEAAPEPSAASAEEQAAVGPDDLDGLLLSASEVNSLLLENNLRIAKDLTNLFTNTTDKEQCGGAAGPALHSGYDGSGYLAVRVHELKDGIGDRFDNLATQAVAAFPSSEDAQRFLDTERQRWDQCAYEAVTMSGAGAAEQTWNVLAPRVVDGVLTVSTSFAGGNGWGCQRGLTARANVVIDVRVCAFGGSAQAPQFAEEIARNVS